MHGAQKMEVPLSVTLCCCSHSQAQSKHGWWLSDLDIQCYSSWHTKFTLVFGLPCVVLLCIGIPLIAAALPIWAYMRKQLQGDHYREVYGFLHWRYRWELQTVLVSCCCRKRSAIHSMSFPRLVHACWVLVQFAPYGDASELCV